MKDKVMAATTYYIAYIQLRLFYTVVHCSRT